MRANASDRAVRAQGGAVVRPRQVRAMLVAARRAYDAQRKIGLVDDGVAFDAWRRATLHDVVGAAAPSSFRAVTQRDYAAVVAYFSSLAGDEVVAAPAGADERRRALWALDREEARLADAFGGAAGARSYADSLIWGIHRSDRATANARQLWATIFTLRARARRKTAAREEAS